MKKFFLLASAAFVLTLGATAQTKADDVAKFDTEKHDFGKIKQGVPVTYIFHIKNITDKPLVVESATAACGCTAPEKIVDPIMPGESAPLKVVYNGSGSGVIDKPVHIKFAGIDMPKTVYLTAEVLSAEAYEVYLKEKDKKPTKN